jgi:hypothetical protein
MDEKDGLKYTRGAEHPATFALMSMKYNRKKIRTAWKAICTCVAIFVPLLISVHKTTH